MTVDPLVPNCVWFMSRFKVRSAALAHAERIDGPVVLPDRIARAPTPTHIPSLTARLARA